MGRSGVRWALSGQYESEGSFQGRDALDNPTGRFTVSSFAGGGHVAYPIAGTIAVGAGAKWVNETLGSSRGAGMTYDAGLQMHAGVLGIGLTAQNVFGKMRFGGSSYDFPTNYGVGLALDHVESGLRVAVDANFPNAYYTDVRGGLEWRWHDLIAVRGGYRSEIGAPSDETLSGPSFGFGTGVYGMWLDYAYVVPGNGGAQHRLGIMLRPGRMNFGGGAVGDLEPAAAEPKPQAGETATPGAPHPTHEIHAHADAQAAEQPAAATAAATPPAPAQAQGQAQEQPVAQASSAPQAQSAEPAQPAAHAQSPAQTQSSVQAQPAAQRPSAPQAPPSTQAQPAAHAQPALHAQAAVHAPPSARARLASRTRLMARARPLAQARPGARVRPGAQVRSTVLARSSVRAPAPVQAPPTARVEATPPAPPPAQASQLPAPVQPAPAEPPPAVAQAPERAQSQAQAEPKKKQKQKKSNAEKAHVAKDPKQSGADDPFDAVIERAKKMKPGDTRIR